MYREDYSYFRRRMAQEEAATRSAAGPQARERHLELAAAYQLRCRLLEELIGTQARMQVAKASLGTLPHRPSAVPLRQARHP